MGPSSRNTLEDRVVRPAAATVGTSAFELRAAVAPSGATAHQHSHCESGAATSEAALERACVDSLFGRDDVDDGVDESEVGERLGEVAEMAPRHRIELFGVQAEGAGERQQLLAHLPSPEILA